MQSQNMYIIKRELYNIKLNILLLMGNKMSSRDVGRRLVTVHVGRDSQQASR